MIGCADFICPTWNSMPEFRTTLCSIRDNIPRDFVHGLFVVDRDSSDGTVELAESFEEFFPIKVLRDVSSLGSARMTGLKRASTDWVCWVDSDIDYWKSWFPSMVKWFDEISDFDEDVGWVHGKTIDDRPRIKKLQLWEAERKFRNGAVCLDKDAVDVFRAKALTNNSLSLRSPLLSADEKIYDVSGCEDGVLTQAMMNAGFSVYAVPALCGHLRVHTYGKWGEFTDAWGISGIRQAGGDPKVRNYLWYLLVGGYTSVKFRNPFYMYYFGRRFLSVVRAIWFNRGVKDRSNVS